MAAFSTLGTARHFDRALRVRDDVTVEVDDVHVVGQLQHDADEPLLEVVVGRFDSQRIIGVDGVEERIIRVFREQRLHVGGREARVILAHVARGARSSVRVLERGLEELFAVRLVLLRACE